MFEFTQVTQVWDKFFKLLIRRKSTQDEKVCLIKGNKLKLAQFEFLSFFFYKIVRWLFDNLIIQIFHPENFITTFFSSEYFYYSTRRLTLLPVLLPCWKSEKLLILDLSLSNLIPCLAKKVLYNAFLAYIFFIQIGGFHSTCNFLGGS